MSGGATFGVIGVTIGDWEVAEDVSRWIEVVAVAVIALAVAVAVGVGIATSASTGLAAGVEAVKRNIGRGLLLGLDLLIAADIIRTVTLEPTLQNVAALGLLVVVRTFLAWSLVVELRGRWPWQLEDSDLRVDAGSPAAGGNDPRPDAA